MSALADGIASALVDSATATEGIFIWNGQPYGCTVNADQNVLVTNKNLFPVNGLPKTGDVITMVLRQGNKNVQITGRANAAEQFIPGGLSADNTFVDDPANPSIAIQFSSFIGT